MRLTAFGKLVSSVYAQRKAWSVVARSVVTLGVSTERGAVHAVALDKGGNLSERVLLRVVRKTRGADDTDVAAAVEAVLDELSAELAADHERGAVAIAYRNPAERRAIVTRLAAGPWHTASMVSPRSAHLSVASMMTWLDEFHNVLVCEVVPGYQAFTLVDRGRRRVLAAVARVGAVTRESLDAGVTAAWDELDAAGTRPDAVVLIGSSGIETAVRGAVRSFGAPVIPCRMAAHASAAGAALSAREDVFQVGDPIEEAFARTSGTDFRASRRARGAAALAAAVGALAIGLVAGGVYAMDGFARPGAAAVAAAGVVANAPQVHGAAGSAGRGGRAAAPEAMPRGSQAGPWHIEPDGSDAWTMAPSAQSPRSDSRQDRSLPLVSAESADAAEANPGTSLVPGTGLPATTEIGPPNGALLFPGESPPPAAFTPEAAEWWDRHFRMMAQWGAKLLPA